MSLALTYDERIAIKTLRKSMCSKPHIITMLLDQQSEEIAYITLKKLSEELNILLNVNQAFQTAAKALITQKRDEKERPAQTPPGQS